jgi:hypothetical protein
VCPDHEGGVGGGCPVNKMSQVPLRLRPQTTSCGVVLDRGVHMVCRTRFSFVLLFYQAFASQ